MESYTDLCLHLQFVCFFQNERLYIDKSNGWNYILPTTKITVNILLNAITGINCIQSAFPQCKLKQSKEKQKKSKINPNSYDVLHIHQIFKCESSS